MLKQVSASLDAPAPVPATKFPWSSCENPPALIPVKAEPSPKNAVAVTELIPEIFVALSPIIFPFALISKVAVR